MKTAQLQNMLKGWFVGNFEPSLYKTNEVEVGVKYYDKGAHEQKHYHKVSLEITTIVSGEVKMNDKFFKAGDIVILEPNEPTDFTSITDSTTVVVKIPSVKDDKYLI
jgi:quercetin dioxygenase-like cupin family protein